MLVAVTPKGERLLERLSEIHKNELRQITPALRRLLEELAGEE